MNEHTPTPWKWFTTGVGVCGLGQVGAEQDPTKLDVLHGEPYGMSAYIRIKEADAEFIVRAVNCHEDFLEACRQALHRLDCQGALSADEEVKLLREAIAKATTPDQEE